MWTHSELDLKESPFSKRKRCRRSFPSVQVGERHLPRLTDKCHESRVKFVYLKDKLGIMQNVSLIERGC
jgi:hypothetical protein